MYIGGLGYGVWLLGVAGHRMCSGSGGWPVTVQRQDLWQAMFLLDLPAFPVLAKLRMGWQTIVEIQYFGKCY